MTTPVTTDDVVQGCRKFLAGKTDLLALLGATDDEPWLFQGKLYQVMEGTQSSAVVLSTMGGWSTPLDYGTAEFPRLSVELYVDPIRDEDNNYIEQAETRRRALLILRTLNKHLHRVIHASQMWGTVRTVGSQRLAEPLLYEVPNGDGMLRAQVFYGVQVLGYLADEE